MDQLRSFKAVFFDLDGTLLDTRALVAISHKHAFKTVLGQDIDEAEIMRDYGRPLRYTFARYAPSRVDEMIQAYRTFMITQHDVMADVFPGVCEGIKSIHALGQTWDPALKIGLVTSKKRPLAERGLQLHQLDSYFDIIVGEEDTQEHKPEPEPLLYAARKLQLMPEDTLYVGDSPYDIMCAHAAGTQSAVVSWSSFRADELLELRPNYVLHSFADLEEIIRQNLH